MSVRWLVGTGILALVVAVAQAQSSGAAVGAPPPPVDEGLLDCSLYRYGDNLGDAVAAIIGRFSAQATASVDLQERARRGVRVEVTDWLRSERLIHRVLDCPQPVLRGFVAGEAVELEFIALQASTCQQLVDSAALARLGATFRVRHGPTGEARCGLSRNPFPGLLTLGRLTQAGRTLPGENMVTVVLGRSVAPGTPLARCRLDEPPQTGLTADLRVHLSQFAAEYDCPLMAHDRSGHAQLACRSLYDTHVRCDGDAVAACRQGLDQVGAAAREWRETYSALDTGTRADLAWRLMTVTPIDTLAGRIDQDRTDVAALAERQLTALNGLLDDGPANIDEAFEHSQAATYRHVENLLIERWLPMITREAGTIGRPADLWGQLGAQQRADLVRKGTQLIADGLGLAPRRLFIVGDCRNEGFPPEQIGGYAPPGASGVFVSDSPHVDRRRADAIFFCANSTRGFAEFDLVLETMLEEAMHAHQMELVMQAEVFKRSADAATCRHARLMAASYSHSFATWCNKLTPHERESNYPINLLQSTWCARVTEPSLYLNRPHEYHAKAFAARVSIPVLKQARR